MAFPGADVSITTDLEHIVCGACRLVLVPKRKSERKEDDDQHQCKKEEKGTMGDEMVGGDRRWGRSKWDNRGTDGGN